MDGVESKSHPWERTPPDFFSDAETIRISGQKGTPTILPGVISALEQIKIWGVEHISDSLIGINNTIAGHLSALGFQMPDRTQRSPHMFGAIIPGRYKGNMISELSSRKIYVSQRGSSVRFSPHLHITENDLNRLIETLEELFR